MSDNDNNSVEPEIVDKDDDKELDSLILTQINQHSYSDRPDLFIKAIEEHSPGFIKELSQDIIKREKDTYKERHRFGKFQAYTGSLIQIVAAIAILLFTGYSFYQNTSSFWNTIALVIFYAVSQGGVEGFMKVINALASVINKNKDKNE